MAEATISVARPRARELANLRIVVEPNRAPLGVVVDLTRASSAEIHALEELAREDLFRHVPGVALVGGDESAACAVRLGLTATLRVDGIASADAMECAIEICRALAGATPDVGRVARHVESSAPRAGSLSAERPAA
jgi:hypothetical protein